MIYGLLPHQKQILKWDINLTLRIIIKHSEIYKNQFYFQPGM